jgi:protein-S-isoprenylcysteine O-methyltransferase Ste14
MPASSASPEPVARGDGWVVAQALLLVAVVVTGLAGPAWSGVTPWLVIPVGALLLSLGALLGLLGMRGLGTNLSPFPRPRRTGQLVSHGVYARVRHPTYGGLMLAGPGWGLLTASVAALALSLVLAAFLVVKARHEEKLLAQRFPEYEDYRGRVRRRFLPWLL